MAHRTKTYISGNWYDDKDAMDKLQQWNENWYLTSSNDLIQPKTVPSYICTNKLFIKTRMGVSKTFVLIVGETTNRLTAGSCEFCKYYNNWTSSCPKGYNVDYRSYVNYECDKAIEEGVKIVVLYHSTTVSKDKCPKAVRNIGTHAAMLYTGSDGESHWDYDAVKKAIEE